MIKVETKGDLMIEWECLFVAPTSKQQEAISRLELELEKAEKNFEEDMTSGEDIPLLEKELEMLTAEATKFRITCVNMSNFEIMEWTSTNCIVGKEDVNVIALVMKDRFGEAMETTIKATKEEFIDFLYFLNASVFNIKNIKGKSTTVVINYDTGNISYTTPLDEYLGETSSTTEDDEPIF